MLKTIILGLSFASIFASQMPPMPPMPPMMGMDINTTKQPVQKQEVVNSCELLPPMVVFIPPPMEDMLNECKNSLKMPKEELVKEKLLKGQYKDAKVEKISVAEGFVQLYAIDLLDKKEKVRLYCNSSVEKCIAGKMVENGK